ncbi:MAG TPA: hypothetical protein VLK32_03050 [Bacillota bacterium]|nr:hypothetical protein [Bacillota bacterium]
MGGKNHKPTKKPFLALSAWLSLKVDEGLVHVHEANIALERAFLAVCCSPDFLMPVSGGDSDNGLVGRRAAAEHLARGEQRLQASLSSIHEVLVGYEDLLNKMEEAGYSGNPLAQKLGQLALADRFTGVVIEPEVLDGPWRRVETWMQYGNLPEAFRREAEEFARLREVTEDLLRAWHKCQEAAEEGTLVDAVETNTIPLRRHFARLFSRRYYVATLFLYSALISTELAYMEQGLPSLTGKACQDLMHASI